MLYPGRQLIRRESSIGCNPLRDWINQPDIKRYIIISVHSIHVYLLKDIQYVFSSEPFTKEIERKREKKRRKEREKERKRKERERKSAREFERKKERDEKE